MRVIPYGRQSIDAEDEAAVLAVLRSPLLTQGPATAAFEADLAAHVGAKYCVAVANGTAALHIAMAGLEMEAGEGITTPNTFVATSNAMAYVGLTPVFADIDPATLNLSPTATRAALTPQTRLIAPVHFAGLPADMPAFQAMAADRDIRIIEDASHAIGSEYVGGGRVGNCRHSDATVFSFHPVKTITAGEGGAITTNDEALYQRLLMLRSHGITRDPARLADNPGPWWYEQQALGFNYRMTEIQAALGASQLRKLDHFMARRQAIVARYHQAFAGLNWLVRPPETPGQSVCQHLYVVQIDFDAIGRTRPQVMATLLAQGVGTQVHYIPVHLQPWYRQSFGTAAGQYPAAEAYYDRALSLPLFPAMSDDDVEQVITAVRGLV
ncbi:UDP-4-amino-4,6-dideoxy-N-acetyl-beta-L-altrosamine transaminase [Brevundimonas sp.]|uniref:UDP-4-amino-4, 6-dideoxy-N-acetyl-beta-L-altrosamine transaminase n=1 Tax=Brevundimonas sp. TaxID=1871086 RepID=UPI0024893415|nr:UDP-4-amino-4,6-dideoxy-N-acetyl-beta-L-altrosamine transaminase [Brevundimonas sp.]MDI1282452.1 UDP-4-amino-4,6-dideoxy-N-acetyl-beta-L-altrosamine transaminase [Brevundimonas sp.]